MKKFSQLLKSITETKESTLTERVVHAALEEFSNYAGGLKNSKELEQMMNDKDYQSVIAGVLPNAIMTWIEEKIPSMNQADHGLLDLVLDAGGDSKEAEKIIKAKLKKMEIG